MRTEDEAQAREFAQATRLAQTDTAHVRHGRRDFLFGAGAAALSAGLVGTPAWLWSHIRDGSPFHSMPESAATLSVSGPGDGGLIVLRSAPYKAETPLDRLDGRVTPLRAHFAQGDPPGAVGATRAWTLGIEGLVRRPVTLEVGAVAHGFPVVTRPLLIECFTNGAAAFAPASVTPPAFTAGAVGNALWTGVPLAALLHAAGVDLRAGGLVAESFDGTHGPILPMAKAMDPATLIAFGMDGTPLTARHGAPLRLVVPGWPEAYSRKWVTRLCVVAPAGTAAPLSVKSLVTAPMQGARIPRSVAVRGSAWAGDLGVARVALSTDFGRHWRDAILEPTADAHSWTRWHADLHFTAPGYAEIWARAVDSRGGVQPLVPDAATGRNNAVHRVWVQVA